MRVQATIESAILFQLLTPLSLVVHEYSAIICIPEERSLSVFMTVVCVRGRNDLRIEVCPCGPNRLNSIHMSAQRSPWIQNIFLSIT